MKKKFHQQSILQHFQVQSYIKSCALFKYTLFCFFYHLEKYVQNLKGSEFSSGSSGKGGQAG